MNSLITVATTELRIQGRVLRVARLHGDNYKFLDRPEPVVRSLRDVAERIDLFTFTQRLSEREPKFSFPMEWDNVAAQEINTFEDWWEKQVDAKTRNMVRKAEKKGIVTREVVLDRSLVEGISTVYNEIPIRQGKPFPHYGKDLDTIYKEEATHLDSSIFIGAFLGKDLVGFIKLVLDDSSTQAGLMNILSLVAHRDKAPTNALIAQAVRSCGSRSVQYLTYSRLSYGKKQEDSLAEFKRNNGFKKVLVPRYYVPLTTIGHTAFRLGLHHGLAEAIPESVAARVRRVRRLCYRVRVAACIGT